MQKGKIPHIYYLYLHSKIWEMNKGVFIQKSFLVKYLFQWRIPKKMRRIIIKEMVLMGLLKENDRYTLEINSPKFKLEDLNKYYHQLKIF